MSKKPNFFLEFAAFGLHNAEINIKLKINHDGEVNRALYLPQNSSFIATKSPSADIVIFNYAKLATQNIDCRPELRLHGHTKEGYGLSWNSNINRHILSASDDQTICLWNIEKPAIERKFVNPLRIFSEHQAVVKVKLNERTKKNFNICFFFNSMLLGIYFMKHFLVSLVMIVN